MLKKLLENKKFFKITADFLKKPEVIDVIIFGSVMRGKTEPGDIDILVVYTANSKERNDETYKFRKQLEQIDKNAHVTDADYNEIFDAGFMPKEALLSEGYSIRQKKFLSESFGYSNFMMFKYSLGKMGKSKRMQFYYSLHGRNKEKGILEKTKSYKFSDAVILSSMENSETIKDFLGKWKIEYKNFPLLIPGRVIKYKILEK